MIFVSSSISLSLSFLKKTQFTEVLREANLDKVVLHNLTNKLDEVLDSKNSQIKGKKYEIARVTKVSLVKSLSAD